MTLKRLSQVFAFCYSVGMVVALFFPRKYPADLVVSRNILSNFLHEILYYSGALEPLGNFLLLIPVFLLVASVAKNYRLIIALFTCASISVLAEVGQSFIPGRVSSIQDLVLNIGGVCATLLIILVFKLVNSEPRISK
ncbi:VanZ-like [Candidatus Nanopelagicaceae bacterium]